MPAIELCGEMLEEHEAAIVQAHAGTDSFASGQHARQVCVQVTKACTEQRFNQALHTVPQYTMPNVPRTHQLNLEESFDDQQHDYDDL